MLDNSPCEEDFVPGACENMVDTLFQNLLKW